MIESEPEITLGLGRRGISFALAACGSVLHAASYPAERESARRGKDWATADRIRETLRAVGVEVYDRDVFKTEHIDTLKSAYAGVFPFDIKGTTATAHLSDVLIIRIVIITITLVFRCRVRHKILVFALLPLLLALLVLLLFLL